MPSNKSFPPDHSGITVPTRTAAADETPARTRAVRAADGRLNGEVGKDALPSNTASGNCNTGYFQALRWGVDSLYLSYPGKIDEAMDERLRRLKETAQSPEAYQRTTAQLELDGHIFEVKDRGAPLFPYVLEDNAFRLQISRSAGKVPLAYVKVSSEYLSHLQPKEAEIALRGLVDQLGDVTEDANVSRIDLFVDFASSENMESWDRQAWVTRARSINTYAVGDEFSGWSIGLGGIISARLYNKTLEIEKSKKTYLHALWKASGWNGSSPVWRLEFELKREVLTEHGLSKLSDVLRNLNGLWNYATIEWLRLTLPNQDDKTRSRWPIHPLWGYLSSVDWEAPGGALSKRFSNARVPDDDKMLSLGFGMVVNYMAKHGIREFYDGLREFEAAMYNFHDSRAFHLGFSFDDYVAERVSIKAREFNSMLNQTPDDARTELYRKAAAYRKASDGE